MNPLNRVEIKSHALDIPARLQELDEHYRIYLNTKSQKYEVFYKESNGCVLECVLPYDELDERTIRHVIKHRIERVHELEREVEEHNRRLEQRAERQWLNEAADRTKEALNYLRRNEKTDEIPKELIKE